jgi:hypothetical protein
MIFAAISEHQINVKKRMHYIVHELDSNGVVIQYRHIVQQELAPKIEM